MIDLGTTYENEHCGESRDNDEGDPILIEKGIVPFRLEFNVVFTRDLVSPNSGRSTRSA